MNEKEDFPFEILYDSRAKVDRMFVPKDRPDDTKYVNSNNDVKGTPKTLIFLFSQSAMNNANYTFKFKG
jgi:hypothetical protein